MHHQFGNAVASIFVDDGTLVILRLMGAVPGNLFPENNIQEPGDRLKLTYLSLARDYGAKSWVDDVTVVGSHNDVRRDLIASLSELFRI